MVLHETYRRILKLSLYPNLPTYRLVIRTPPVIHTHRPARELCFKPARGGSVSCVLWRANVNVTVVCVHVIEFTEFTDASNEDLA